MYTYIVVCVDITICILPAQIPRTFSHFYFTLTVCREFIREFVVQSMWGSISVGAWASLVDRARVYSTALASNGHTRDGDVWHNRRCLDTHPNVWRCIHKITGCRSDITDNLCLLEVSWNRWEFWSFIMNLAPVWERVDIKFPLWGQSIP